MKKCINAITGNPVCNECKERIGNIQGFKPADCYEHEKISIIKNLLLEANGIMNERSEEKNREYGPFVESINRAAFIATQLSEVTISPETMVKCLIALKLGRLKYNLKDDTIMDAMAYLDGLQKIREDNIPF